MNRDTFIYIPAYNVEKELPALLASIPAEVLLRAVSVTVLDDGSSDATALVASRFATSEVRAKIVVERFSRNSGYGAVVKRGLALALKSEAAFAVCLHGDGQYPAAKIPQFLARMADEGVDVLQGSRHHEPGSARKGNMPAYKRWGGAFLTAIENRCFTNRLTDRHSGFLCYSARFLRCADFSRLSDSFDIDLELLAVAESRGLSVREEAIPTRYAGEKSSLNVLRYGLRALRVARKHRRGGYYPGKQ